MDYKEHWEKIYSTKKLSEVSWYQKNPAPSLSMFQSGKVGKDSSIIDVGGGDSFLVDLLLKQGFTDVTVLDISEKAIDRAKYRLGELSDKVSWVTSNILDYEPNKSFDVWHDRAAFHFLTDRKQVDTYKSILNSGLAQNGQMMLATFSESGPGQCSGINIKKYSLGELESEFSSQFVKEEAFRELHKTPFDTTQDFSFIRLRKQA